MCIRKLGVLCVRREVRSLCSSVGERCKQLKKEIIRGEDDFSITPPPTHTDTRTQWGTKVG